MSTRARSWWYKTLVAIWIAASVLAAFYVSRPAQVVPLPSGWTVWSTPGPTLAVMPTPEGMYAGGLRGLFRLEEDGSATPINIPATKGSVTVAALLSDASGVLWVGHDQGLSIRAGSKWTTLGESEGLPDRAVRAIAETGDGFVWIGTMKGAVRLPVDGPWDTTAMVTLTTRDGLLAEEVSAIIQGPDGAIWFGSCAAPAGGLSRRDGEQWLHWTPQSGLPHADVTSLMVARDGSVWVGCGFCDEGGAAVFSRASHEWKLQHRVPTEELLGPKVRSLFQDSRGRIWIGSEYNGVAIRSERETVLTLTPDDGLPGGEGMSIAEAEDQAIWLGTPGGVVRIAPDALVSALARWLEAKPGATP